MKLMKFLPLSSTSKLRRKGNFHICLNLFTYAVKNIQQYNEEKNYNKGKYYFSSMKVILLYEKIESGTLYVTCKKVRKGFWLMFHGIYVLWHFMKNNYCFSMHFVWAYSGIILK